MWFTEIPCIELCNEFLLFHKEKAAKRIKHLELGGHDVSGLRSRMLTISLPITTVSYVSSIDEE